MAKIGYKRMLIRKGSDGRSKDMTALDPGRTEGDYDLSNPINSFIDVVRRLVFQPLSFFAGLPE